MVRLHTTPAGAIPAFTVNFASRRKSTDTCRGDERHELEMNSTSRAGTKDEGEKTVKRRRGSTVSAHNMTSLHTDSTTSTTTPASAENHESHAIDRPSLRSAAPPEREPALHRTPEDGQGRGADTQMTASLFSTSTSKTPGEIDSAMKILAKSVARELSKHGYGPREAIVLSTELVRLISAELEHRRKMHQASLPNGAGQERLS
ncbi:hypothetical protein [Sorangium sp. So ce363]|uniref:hypothetical protein n=1 Tax=Sorangium sp. So ce363 TaxID=3133304 RepID=UPI003F648425